MIENDEQMRKAQKAIAYWHDAITKGGGSWLGNENTRTEILHLRKEIADYERRKAAGAATTESLSAAPPATATEAVEG
jgi:hypothetical protein